MLILNNSICAIDAINPRKNNFNFLRLLFASLVLLSHSFEILDGNKSRELLTNIFGTITFGGFAVDGFFLLSGYLIVKSWDLEPNARSFLLKRILRIYPGFIVAALISAFVVGPLGAELVSYFSQLDLTKFAIVTLMLGPPRVPPVFAGQHYPSVNGSMWTISFEFICYIAVLLLGVIGLVKWRKGWLLITAIFFVIMICHQMGFEFTLFGRIFNFKNQFWRLGLFFFSGGTYYLFRDKIIFSSWMVWVLGGILLLSMFQSALTEIALAAIGGYLLFYFAFLPVSLLRSFQTLPDVSYGLYLYGWPIQMLLIWYFPNLPAFSVFLFSLLAGILAGFLSWNLVEKPFLKFKPKGQKLAKANVVVAAPI